jgi:hypothetical protein
VLNELAGAGPWEYFNHILGMIAICIAIKFLTSKQEYSMSLQMKQQLSELKKQADADLKLTTKEAILEEDIINDANH